MFDVETLGNTGNFVTLSLAAVQFDINSMEIGRKKVFYFPIEESIKSGMVIDKSTLLWWLDNDISIFKRQITGSEKTLKESFEDVIRFFQEVNPERVWASASLDYQALENLSFATGLKNPVSYNKRLCTRTVKAITKFTETGRPNSHDPMDDCMLEIKRLISCLKDITH